MIKLLVAGITFLVFYFDRKPYSKLIKTWCTLFHMKIRYYNRYTDKFEVDVVDNILYISRYNKATHTVEEYVYSLAHEIGHLIDYAYKEHYYEDDMVASKLTDKQAVYQDEVVAWKIARVLLIEANEPGLFNQKTFNSLKNRCLNEYKKALDL